MGAASYMHSFRHPLNARTTRDSSAWKSQRPPNLAFQRQGCWHIAAFLLIHISDGWPHRFCSRGLGHETPQVRKSANPHMASSWSRLVLVAHATFYNSCHPSIHDCGFVPVEDYSILSPHRALAQKTANMTRGDTRRKACTHCTRGKRKCDLQHPSVNLAPAIPR
jgi:hypothetical protein